MTTPSINGSMLSSNDLSRFALLYVSCDKYSDLWKPYFQLFWRYWPDCPVRVYLLSNTVEIKIEKVTVMPVGNDVSWSDNLISALQRLQEEYVLILLDDFLFVDYVDSKKILDILSWVLIAKPNYVRINSDQPKPVKPVNQYVGTLPPGALYRTSLRFPIWKKEVLLRVLAEGESAWDFETKGSIRSDEYGEFYSSFEDCINSVNCVIKGKWNRDALRRIQSLDFDIEGIDPGKRPIMTRLEMASEYLRNMRTHVLNLFPSRHRRGVKRAAKSFARLFYWT